MVHARPKTLLSRSLLLPYFKGVCHQKRRSPRALCPKTHPWTVDVKHVKFCPKIHPWTVDVKHVKFCPKIHPWTVNFKEEVPTEALCPKMPPWTVGFKTVESP